MSDHLNNPKAKAEAKAHIEKAEKKATKKAEAQAKPPVATTRAQIKALWRQYPKEARLFGHIMAKWRASGAIKPGTTGKWAAYTHEEWEGFTGIPVSSLKRHLDRLEGWGLIERDRGQFEGRRVLSFIRPSPQGLRLSAHKDRDWERLGTTETEAVYHAPAKANPEVALVLGPVTEWGFEAALAKAMEHWDEKDPLPKTMKELLAIKHEDGFQKFNDKGEVMPTKAELYAPPKTLKTHLD